MEAYVGARARLDRAYEVEEVVEADVEAYVGARARLDRAYEVEEARDAASSGGVGNGCSRTLTSSG